MTFGVPTKRSVTIAGHETSISLEAVFWQALERAASDEALPLNALIARIDAARIEALPPPNLASAIRQLQSGSSDRAQLLSTLNESLDQLKLTIDAMKLPRGDIAALLADLRYRLEPRLLASDLALHWHVAPIAPVLRFDSEALRQIQYVVYEAFSNVIQHAKARSLTLALDENNAKIVLSITDDGRGYDVPTVRARGLAAMRQRCEAIGADLLVTSVPGATCVRILISR